MEFWWESRGLFRYVRGSRTISGASLFCYRRSLLCEKFVCDLCEPVNKSDNYFCFFHCPKRKKRGKHRGSLTLRACNAISFSLSYSSSVVKGGMRGRRWMSHVRVVRYCRSFLSPTLEAFSRPEAGHLNKVDAIQWIHVKDPCFSSLLDTASNHE